MLRARIAVAAVAVATAACTPRARSPKNRLAVSSLPDATNSHDAGFDDRGFPIDVGFIDVGFPDVGFPDVGFLDGGFDEAGQPIDAGFLDAGFIDAGFPDAGFPDAGFPDSGVPYDAGPPPPLPVGCDPPVGPNNANTLYFCDCAPGAAANCVPGNDNNDGLSASAPKRSLSEATNAFNAGVVGRIQALCRGGAWQTSSGMNLTMPASCDPAAPCTIADYGDPQDPLPIIEVTGQGVGALQMDPSVDQPARRGFEFRNLHLRRSANAQGTGNGVFMFRNLSDMRMSCLDIHGHRIGVQVSSIAATPRIHLENSRVYDNYIQGYLGGCSECSIVGSEFVNNGGEGTVFNHNIYISGADNQTGTFNMRVIGNYISRNAVNGQGRCNGTSLNVHGGLIENLLIENNVLEEPAGGAEPTCWGIAVDASSSSADTNLRTVVRGNTVRNVGGIGIGLSSCVECVVENNLIIQEAAVAFEGIAVPSWSNTAANDATTTNMTVRNNTLWFGGNAGGAYGIRVGGEGNSHVVANNIVAMDPSIVSPGPCFAFDLPGSAYSLVDSNLAFGCPQFDANNSGFDGNRITTDPLFVGAPADLHLQSGSPARDSGNAGSAPATDMDGNARDGQPDRGAYEYQ